ncbi:MAG: glycoside hydrolase family 88 protein [Oscillospiraceae bacterium]|nr:glycoside hydrolase family 88 protein [Oscillospiraceae bacterium]
MQAYLKCDLQSVPLNYAITGADTLMRKFTPAKLPPAGHFHYHQGVFLTGVERVYQLTGNTKYFDYIKAWADLLIDENGVCASSDPALLDDIQPGNILFNLYREMGDKRYKTLLDTLFRRVEMWPTNAKGGVWHMHFKKNQMWLDTMYMMGVFTTKYAVEFNEPYMIERVYTQAELMYKNMLNPDMGLLYHMWDDSKAHQAVDRETGLIKVHWGRAMSWFVVALAEIIEMLPVKSKIRQRFVDIEVPLVNAVMKYQDTETGLWYQVIDKPKDKHNWTESSCSALFTYALAKCLRLGIIPNTYQSAVIRGYEGVINYKIELREGDLIMKDICIGTGVGNEDYYFDRPTSENDLHGMGAFLMMCTEKENIKI